MSNPSTFDPGPGRAAGSAVLGAATRVDDRSPVLSRRQGQLFGGLVLAAFVLYGIGSALVDEPVGLVLVTLNSLAVGVIGLIGFRLLRADSFGIGAGYLGARILEAVLLAGGVAVVALTSSTDADTTGYLLAMIALGVGSVPFCRALERGRWLPSWLARWGMVGYAALVIGALLELATGRAVTVLFAVPGGLFELTLGLVLLKRGFGRPTPTPTPTPTSMPMPTSTPTPTPRPAGL